jgi:alanine-synthesizing transaminase
MDEFYRIKRLPPYVFAIVNDLKTKARARGEDIIDLGMGNPDQATPGHIVDKLAAAARNPRNHRYSGDHPPQGRDHELVPAAVRGRA